MERRVYEDVVVGQALHTLKKGPMSTAHIMRWSAAIENWHRIHYDRRFATAQDGLPDVLVNGSWKQHVLVQLMKDGLGPGGWLWKIRFRYLAPDIAGDTITARADVVRKQEVGGFGFITCSVTLANERSGVSTAGVAIGVLPLKKGPPVPYPFPKHAEFDAIALPEDIRP